MAELDLIPEDYRQLLRLRRVLNYFVAFFILLIICIGVGKTILSSKLSNIDLSITDLELNKEVETGKHQELINLNNTRKKLESRVQILRDLRRGPPAADMFVVLDRALDKGIWFNKWSFMRAGEFREVEANSDNNGYFIIVEENKSQIQEKTWLLNTHMEIEGEALDHTFLAAFVNRLITQPEIDDVKVLETTLRSYIGRDVVSFSIAVTVNNQYGRSYD